MTDANIRRDAEYLCGTMLSGVSAMGKTPEHRNGEALRMPRFLPMSIPEVTAAHGVATSPAPEADPLPSCFPVTGLAAASIGAAGAALSALLPAGQGSTDTPPPSVSVDVRRAALWFGVSLQAIEWAPPAAWDAIAGDYRTADGWIRLHTNAPAHRQAVLAVLQLPEGLANLPAAQARKAVQDQVAQWQAGALEDDVIASGGCAAQRLTQAEWATHPQGRAVAAEPLIDWTDVPFEGSGVARWRIEAGTTLRDRPLAGLRVLDLTRILAGPVATRFLAGFGADVLRIDPPAWDEPSLAPDVTVGKHCARLDLRRAADRRTFETLLAGADVLIHGYRPGALDALGYDAGRRAALCPGLIDVSLSAYGQTGPWASRRGFDSLVQMSSGIADAGMHWRNGDQPFPLPVQALDHATGYLIAAAALRGLALRHHTGHGGIGTLSLARTAHLLTSASSPQSDATPYDAAALRAAATAEDFSPLVEQTSWGPAHRLIPAIAIDGAPMRWSLPARTLGQDAAAWTTPKR